MGDKKTVKRRNGFRLLLMFIHLTRCLNLCSYLFWRTDCSDLFCRKICRLFFLLLRGRLLLLLLPLPTPTRSIHPPPDNQPIRPHLLIVNQAVLPFWHCGCEFHLCVSCVSVYYSVVLVDIPRYGDVWFVQHAVLMSGSAHSSVNFMLMHLIHEFGYMLSF